MENEKEEFLRPLILDIGSANFRLGFAGEDLPDIIVPSIYTDITDPIYKSDNISGLKDIVISKNTEKHLYGSEALKYKDILNTHQFVIEKNYNVLKKFFLYYYHQLGIEQNFFFQQPLIVLFPFTSSENDKKKMQQIFLDELNFPQINFLTFSDCVLSAIGKNTGVVINLGEQNSFVSTYLHGFSNFSARDFFPIAGKDLTEYFMDLILFNKKYKINYIDKWIAREIKDRSSICVFNPKETKKKIEEGLSSFDQEIQLPDGCIFTINYERIMIPEPLFNPNRIHLDIIELPKMIADLVKTWNRNEWLELLQNIILCGGTSLIKDLGKRLKVEVGKFFSEKIRDEIKVITPTGRDNMGWIGASILYSRGLITKGWIENPNYQNKNQNGEVISQPPSNEVDED